MRAVFEKIGLDSTMLLMELGSKHRCLHGIQNAKSTSQENKTISKIHKVTIVYI